MSMKLKFALVGIAAMLVFAATHANAQVAIAGSSALYLEMGQAAGSNAAIGGCVWDSGSTKVFQLADSRFAEAISDTATAWISWQPNGNCSTPVAGSEIVYLSTDSTVGNRCFFANPRCTVVPLAAISGGMASASTLSPVTETSLPAAVLTAVSNISVSVAATDIRPEDAKFATLRALTPCGNPVVAGSQYLGLGYNSGDQIKGATSIILNGTGGGFNVGNFNLMGTDPYTTHALPSSFTVTPVGAVPVVVFVNPSNTAGFGSLLVSNINRATLAGYLDGTYGRTTDLVPAGAGSATGATVVIREPLSGTYNTMEYAIPNSVENQSSQDVGLVSLNAFNNQSTFPYFNCTAVGGTVASNPLAETDTRSGGITGKRARAIGTGNMVKAILATPDSLGYSFWSASNFANATAANAKYLTVDGIDPIQETWTDGLVPTSGNDLLGDVSLAHVKDGSYPIWSVLRLVSDNSGSGYTVAQNLASAALSFLSPAQPDFVPMTQLGVVRSHFSPPGVSYPGNGGNPSDGVGSAESGGDVAGLVYSKTAETDYNADNGASTGNVGHRQ